MVARVRTPTVPVVAPTLADTSFPITTTHQVSNDNDLLNWAKSNASVAIAPGMGTSVLGGVPDFRPFPGANLHSGMSSAVRPTARIDDPFYSPPDPTLASPVGTVALAPDADRWPSPRTADADRDPFGSDSAIAYANSLDRQKDIDGSHRASGFQVHNRYLVTQDEAGMVVIDQHALHERILYEQIKTKVLSRSLDKQRLLVPEPVTLTPNEAAAAVEARETLAEIGIELEPFGGDTVLVTAYPAMLAKMGRAEMLRQILEPLMAGGKQADARNLLDELMNMMACKAAVKAGDKLTSEEITALLEQREHYQDTHHCPHGRPTALFFSREQLDKMFKRT
jgi:DNA mismatch repair protein MutL